MKQETPLQKLQDVISFIKLHYQNEISRNMEEYIGISLKGKIDVIESIETEIKTLLPYEREVIENTFREGKIVIRESVGKLETTAYEYFEQTFKTDNQ